MEHNKIMKIKGDESEITLINFYSEKIKRGGYIQINLVWNNGKLTCGGNWYSGGLLLPGFGRSGEVTLARTFMITLPVMSWTTDVRSGEGVAGWVARLPESEVLMLIGGVVKLCSTVNAPSSNSAGDQSTLGLRECDTWKFGDMMNLEMVWSKDENGMVPICQTNGELI